LTANSELVARVRTTTRLHMRTESKHKLRALRDALAPDDQMLLMLHLDRALPWREIAMITLEQGETLESELLDREAARLRKRFERVKAELKQAALRAGLIHVSKPRKVL
jgi:hypothetical protein